MSYKYIKGWFVNTETKVAVREPAFIINTEEWSILYYGEYRKLELIFQSISSKLDVVLWKFDLANFSIKEMENLLNDFAFNRDYIKFQLMRLIKYKSKEVSSMALDTKNLAESKCDNCGISAEAMINCSDICYVCYECESVFCDACYSEVTESDESSEDVVIICPNCGATMSEITEEDLEKPSFGEMFD